MKKHLNRFISMAATAAVLSFAVEANAASDNSVTEFPAEGNVQCSDYALNSAVLSMKTSSPVNGAVLSGPENPNDADTTGESATLNMISASIAGFTATTPVDFALLKSGREVRVFIYGSGGINSDANMALPSGKILSAISLCYGLGNNAPPPPPTLSVVIDAPAPDQVFQFGQAIDFSSTVTNASNPAFFWVFGNATPATAGTEDFSGVAFNASGDQTVSLTVVDDATAQTASASVDFSILTPPLETLPSCSADGALGSLDSTTVGCPLDGSAALVCNFEPGKPNFGLNDESCCSCGPKPVIECDPELEWDGSVNSDACPRSSQTELGVNIQGYRDPASYYCITTGGTRRCYRD